MLKKICMLLLLFSVKEVYSTGDEDHQVGSSIQGHELAAVLSNVYKQGAKNMKQLINEREEQRKVSYDKKLGKAGLNLIRKQIVLSIVILIYADYYSNGGDGIKIY